MVNKKVVLMGYLDSKNRANDYFIEWLTLDGRNLTECLDEADFDYPTKVTITFEKEPNH